MNVVQKFTLMLFSVLILAGATIAAETMRTAAPEPGDQQPALMLAKLASTQKITNGLVTKDFEEILRGAKELSRICEATEWAAHEDRIYAHHRTELRKQAEKLQKLATEGNLDGAAFTYMHSLTTCISCHEYCRDVLRISDDSESQFKVVPIPTSEVEVRLPLDAPVRR